MSELPEIGTDNQSVEPAALAGHYLRVFASAVASMSDFEGFIDALNGLVRDDTFFLGTAELSNAFADGDEKFPDFETLDSSETVVAVAGDAGNLGYLKYSGRQDKQPFGAEDMHLMGSIAGFISALISQAHEFRQKSKADRVLQFLINQLPLGVICFDSKGDVLVQSNSAANLVGDAGAAILAELISSEKTFVKDRARLHFEAGGKLVYAEGRRLQVEEGLKVVAFLLYDMSASREKLLVDLEREAYRSEARGTFLTLALLEMDDEAGKVYRTLRSAAKSLQIDVSKIQPVDAYSCACVFAGKRMRAVRFLLRALLNKAATPVKVSIVQHEGATSEDNPADMMLEVAKESLAVAEVALLPKLLVLDPYPAIFDALTVITNEVCQLDAAQSVESASTLLATGRYDGIFVDLDSYHLDEIAVLREAAVLACDGFKFLYCSHKQPGMARHSNALRPEEIVLQKPFHADKIVEILSLQFDLA